MTTMFKCKATTKGMLDRSAAAVCDALASIGVEGACHGMAGQVYWVEVADSKAAAIAAARVHMKAAGFPEVVASIALFGKPVRS